MTIITENTQIDTPAVVSMFDARKRRYDQAIATYNAWFESDTRCECSYVDSVISDLELIEAIEERERELFDTPAHTLADVAFKVQLSIYEMDDCPDDWKPAKQNLNAAITSLRAGDGLVAIQSIEAALHVEVERDPELFEQSLHGATAALDDLRRMFAESLS